MMSVKSACLILTLGSIIFIQACGKKSNKVEIDRRQTKQNDRTDDGFVPRSSNDFPDDSSSDVSIEVAVKNTGKPSLSKQISDAQDILLPIYSEMEASKLDGTIDLRLALEALDLLSTMQNAEKKADFCTKLGAFASKLQNLPAATDKRDSWLKSIQSLQAKAEICE